MYKLKEYAPEDAPALDRLINVYLGEAGLEDNASIDYINKMELSPTMQRWCLYVEDKLIGFLMTLTLPSLVDRTILTSTELHFYVDPAHRKGRAFIYLYNHWLLCCKTQGVNYMSMNKSDYVSDGMLNKLGFTIPSTSFSKEVYNG